MAEVLTDSGEASRKARADLEAIGVTLYDVKTGALLPMDQLLPGIVLKLSQMSDTQKRNAMAVEDLGRGGLLLLPLAGDFDELAEAVRRTGIVMSSDGVKGAEEYHKQLTLLGMEAESQSNKIGKFFGQGLLGTSAFLGVAGALLSMPFKAPQPAAKPSDTESSKATNQAADQMRADVERNNETVKAALAQATDPLKSAQQHLAELYTELKTGVLPAVNAPILSQIASEKAHIASLKAEAIAVKETAEDEKRLADIRLRSAEARLRSPAEKPPAQFDVFKNTIAPNNDAGIEALRIQGEAASMKTPEGARKVFQEEMPSLVRAAQESLRKWADETVTAMNKTSEAGIKAETRALQFKLKSDNQKLEGEIKADQKILAADDKLKEQQRRADEIEAQNALDHEKRVLDAAKSGIEEQFKLGEMSSHQRINQLKDLYDQEYKLELDQLKREMALAATPEDKARVGGRMQNATDTHNSAISGLNAQGLGIDVKQEQAVFGDMEKSLSQALTKMATETGSFGKVWRTMLQGMYTDLVAALARQVAKYVESIALKTAAELGFSNLLRALKFGDAALSKATGAAAGASQIATSAGVAGAGAVAATAPIPFVGPALAPAAGAMAAAEALSFMSLLGFEGGGVMGDSAGLALLHPKEMVLPAPISQAVQSMATGPTSNTQGGGGDLHVHYHGYAGQTPESMKSDSKQVAKHVDREMRRRNMQPVFAK